MKGKALREIRSLLFAFFGACAVITSAVQLCAQGLPEGGNQISDERRNQIIEQLVRIRQPGIGYYDRYLNEFHSLDNGTQLAIALALMPDAFYPDNAHGGPDLSSEYIELVRNLRVPEEMIEAILAEATENGADEDWDLPAFEEALLQLREAGDIGANTFGDLISFSPDITSQLYIVVVSLATQQGLEEDRRGLEEDRRGLEEDRRGLEEDRRGLEELREIRRQQEEILGNN